MMKLMFAGFHDQNDIGFWSGLWRAFCEQSAGPNQAWYATREIHINVREAQGRYVAKSRWCWWAWIRGALSAHWKQTSLRRNRQPGIVRYGVRLCNESEKDA